MYSNLINIKRTGNIAGLYLMIRYTSQYMHRFQNKECISSTHTTYHTLVKISIVLLGVAILCSVSTYIHTDIYVLLFQCDHVFIPNLKYILLCKPWWVKTCVCIECRQRNVEEVLSLSLSIYIYIYIYVCVCVYGWVASLQCNSSWSILFWLKTPGIGVRGKCGWDEKLEGWEMSNKGVDRTGWVTFYRDGIGRLMVGEVYGVSGLLDVAVTDCWLVQLLTPCGKVLGQRVRGL